MFYAGENAAKKFNIPYATSGMAGVDKDWMDRMNANSMWGAFDILGIHPYGYPYSPDAFDEAVVESNHWANEGSLKRMRTAFNNYGEKRAQVFELGWPTTPGDKRQCDIRSQADYLIRSYTMCLEAGIERIQWYCYQDLVGDGWHSGFDAFDNEFHFGVLYGPNFYGTVMPKPSAIAFANMTRELNTVKTVSRLTNPSGTSRAYRAVLSDNSQVTIAWSNCSRVQNDTGSNEMREATLPWKNQYKSSENITFNAIEAVIVTDSMGNTKSYQPSGGTVTIPLTGSPVFIKGIQ